jgi:putative endonuclease
MNWLVYIIQLNNQAYYTGITNNLAKRLKAHESGKGSKYVRAHLPFILVYKEACKDRSEASKREAAIKRLNRKQKQILVGGIKNE